MPYGGEKTDASVVIRCAYDHRIFRCIDSIDEDVDVVVSTVFDESIVRGLRERGVRYCLSPRNNLSITSNRGFDAAQHDKVILTDSDTVFARGCIRRMCEELDSKKIVRARLEFETSMRLRTSKLVASARDYVNSKELTFTPGIGVRREVTDEIGGFLFNEDVPFAVDADLDHRVKRNRVEVGFLHDAVIIHDAESMFHDLKAAKRIGRGVSISSRSLSHLYKDQATAGQLRRALKVVHLSDYPDILANRGPSTVLYQALWDLHFHIGSASESIENRVGWQR